MNKSRGAYVSFLEHSGLLFAVLALAGAGNAVSAQDAAGEDANDPSVEQARSLFEAGQAAFEAANFEAALRYFRESYEISRRPGLLYNIGLAADRLRHDEEALEAFRGYLRDAGGEAPRRADAEARIAVLIREIDGDRRAGEGVPERAAATGDTQVLAGWSTFGAGLAVLATGAVFLGMGQADASLVESQPMGTVFTPELVDAADRAKWMRITGWVLAGVGLAAAATGIVLALITPTPTESASLELRPTGLAFVWRGQ